MEALYLIKMYKKNNPSGHYFDDDTLRFFGERISEMNVLEETKVIDGVECYVLSSIQHNHPCGATRHYAYFNVNNFEEIGGEYEY